MVHAARCGRQLSRIGSPICTASSLKELPLLRVTGAAAGITRLHQVAYRLPLMVTGARDAPARYVGFDESSGRLADSQPAGGCLPGSISAG